RAPPPRRPGWRVMPRTHATPRGSKAALLFFFNDPAPPEISPLPLPDALPISTPAACPPGPSSRTTNPAGGSLSIRKRSEEHTSELQSLTNLVCRLLLEKK